MHAIQKELASCGDDTIWLSIWNKNDRAIRFYAKLGFTDCGAWQFRFGNEEHENRILINEMKKE